MDKAIAIGIYQQRTIKGKDANGNSIEIKQVQVCEEKYKDKHDNVQATKVRGGRSSTEDEMNKFAFDTCGSAGQIKDMPSSSGNGNAGSKKKNRPSRTCWRSLTVNP